VRALLVAAVVVGVAAGCGEAKPDPAAEAASGVRSVLAERLDSDPDDVIVTCPEDLDVDPGVTFACAVGVAGAAPVDIDLAVAADGTVELRRAVVPTSAAEAYLVAELAGPAEGPVTADCGAAPLLVADVGDELRCEVVRSSDGAVRTVTVTVLGLDGTVRYQVEAEAATTTTVPTTTVPTGATIVVTSPP
jgi:hypothetical protein